ncbi:hypothetical protein [Cupriavidus pauculus]|uniref:hypothetical protein n=1 Tax=Cupriavidus pauculus TaxID=82633 RepID=UPI001FD0082D|nr:hypothetical protein [Cupriavidus pauculus]
MKLEIEGKASISNPTAVLIVRTIRSLKSYGRSSYASLTNESGSYVQVAGGGVSCMVEQFDAPTEVRSRAFHNKPNAARPDGTVLVFGAGNLPMRSDEWFMANQVVEIFFAFHSNAPFPGYVRWRPAPLL